MIQSVGKRAENRWQIQETERNRMTKKHITKLEMFKTIVQLKYRFIVIKKSQ